MILGGQIALGHGGGHAGDVANLIGQVARHGVDAFGEILPGSGDAGHHRLAAQLAFGAHFARHARHFGSERIELVHHGVDHARGVQEFAAQRPPVHFERHGLRQIALGHRADHARDFGGRLDQIADQAVDRFDALRPGSGRRADGGALRDLAFLADRPADAVELTDHLLVEFQDVVERVGDLAVHAGPVHRHPNGEVALLKAISVLSRTLASPFFSSVPVTIALFIE